jgi:CheY-like chemotaxis protein
MVRGVRVGEPRCIPTRPLEIEPTMSVPTTTLDPTASPAAPAPLRVVIADDHPVYRDGIARALLDRGRFYRLVGETGDGEVALRLIARHRPDVALLDVRMPTLDGLAILRRLRRDGIPVPVVLLSAFASPRSSSRR